MKKQLIKKTAGYLIIIIIFYFLFKNLFKNFENIPKEIPNINITYLVIAFLFFFLFYIVDAIIWKLIVHRLNHSLNFRSALKIRCISEIGRYTPGKVWHIIGRVYYSEKVGIPKVTTLTSLVIEQLLMIISTVLLFLIFSSKLIKINTIEIIILLILILILLWILRTEKFNILLNKILMKVKKTQEKVKISLSVFQLVKFLIYYLISWIIIGLAFYFVIKSIYPSSSLNILILAGIFSFSWIIGFFSILTPGGLGVREGILTLFLVNYVPPSIAIIVPIAMRVISIIVELSLALITLKIN